MGEAEDILRAIDRLYAAVAVPDLWPAALEGIADLVEADHTILLAASDGVPFVARARVAPRDLVSSTGGARADVMPHSYLMPHRFGSGAGGHLHATYGSGKPVGSDHAKAAVLQQVLPHLANALALRNRLSLAEERLAGLAAAIDRFDTATVLIDSTGRISHVNPRAAALAAGLDGLRIDRTGLAGATPAATRKLRAAIAAVIGQGELMRRLRLQRPSYRPPLLVTVQAIWRMEIAMPGASTPCAAVFVQEPDAPVTIDRQAVADAFSLTGRETDVALLVADGVDLPAIAGRLGLGIGTVRYHLKNVFDKTDTHSQAALVALVRGFVASAR
jgi:DNA-binding CsgD family transcriptional regulator